MSATNSDESNDLITFKCMKVGGRLRVRIVTSGYNPNANCQFHRAIRKDGCIYTAPVSALKFAQGPTGKFFYRVNGKMVKIVGDIDYNNSVISTIKVYGDDEDTDCAVCFDNEKDVVFVPCGHYCCCDTCFKSLPTKKCVLCRQQITQAVPRSQIQC